MSNKAFPVIEAEDDKPVDNDEDDPAPELEEDDISGPALTSVQKLNIKKIHNNCGHPSKTEFLRCLRLSGAQGRVLKYVRKEFACSSCDAKGHMPKARLPASLPRTFRFNETIGIDLVEVKDPWGEKHTFVNIVCWGTLFQILARVEDKKAVTF